MAVQETTSPVTTCHRLSSKDLDESLVTEPLISIEDIGDGTMQVYLQGASSDGQRYVVPSDLRPSKARLCALRDALLRIVPLEN